MQRPIRQSPGRSRKFLEKMYPGEAARQELKSARWPDPCRGLPHREVVGSHLVDCEKAPSAFLSTDDRIGMNRVSYRLALIAIVGVGD